MRWSLFIAALLPLGCGPVGGGQDAGPADDSRPPRLDPVSAIDAARDRPLDALSERRPDSGSDAPLLTTRDASEPKSDAPCDAAYDADSGDAGDAPACPGILCASFQDSDETVWKVGTGLTSEWSARGGMCSVGTSSATSEYVTGSVTWTDVSVRARVRVIRFGEDLSAYRVGLVARYSAEPYAYYAVFLRGDSRIEVRRQGQQLGSSVEVPMALNQWHTLELRVSGPPQEVSVAALFDGELVAAVADTRGPAWGQVGLATYGSGIQAQFDDVIVFSLEGQPTLAP